MPYVFCDKPCAFPGAVNRPDFNAVKRLKIAVATARKPCPKFYVPCGVGWVGCCAVCQALPCLRNQCEASHLRTGSSKSFNAA